jgi:hypothetical protein
MMQTNFSTLEPQAVPHEPSIPLDTAKKKICAALTDVMGSHGEILASRVEKAKEFQELRELLAAISPVVEAFGSRTALQGFIQRVGKIF